MMLTPEALRPLLRQMTREMGSVPAILHWLTGCPEQPPAQGAYSDVLEVRRIFAMCEKVLRPPEPIA